MRILEWSHFDCFYVSSLEVKEEEEEDKPPTLENQIKVRYPQHLRIIYLDEDEEDDENIDSGDDSDMEEDDEKVRQIS